MTTLTLRYLIANGYATFRGFNVGERQVHGWASSPLTSDNPRRYFTREARQWAKLAMCDKVSVRSVRRFEDLEA
jgi:hypothetical protein